MKKVTYRQKRIKEERKLLYIYSGFEIGPLFKAAEYLLVYRALHPKFMDGLAQYIRTVRRSIKAMKEYKGEAYPELAIEFERIFDKQTSLLKRELNKK